MEDRLRKIGFSRGLGMVTQGAGPAPEEIASQQEKPGSSAARKLMLALAAIPAFALARRGVSRYLGRKFPKLPPPPKVKR